MSFRLRNCPSRILLLAFALSAPWVPLWGQESASPRTPQNGNTQTSPLDPSKAEDPKSGGALKPRLGDWQLLIGSDGKPTPVPVDANLVEFLRRSQTEPRPAERPRYSFSDVSLTGTASDEGVALTVSLSLQISEPDEWVRVPLGLNEAVLREFKHSFEPAVRAPELPEPAAQAGFAGFDRRGGYDWWFQGKGQHVLKLEMVVPLKKSSGVRRLQLAVPPAASSYLKLAVPIAKDRFSLETVVAGAHKIKSLDKNTTEVELFRLGERLDLSWRTLPDSTQVTTLLNAETELRVEPTTEESIVLKAIQLVEPFQGSMSEVEVSLPKGFAILELKLDGERYRSMDDFADAPGPVKISLPAPTTNRIRLDWILQAPWPESGEVVVEGFEVGNSLPQSGKIRIVALEGYRIVKRSATGVNRINAPELSGPSPIFSAYEFRHPFQLVLGLQQIEPSYSIRPHLFLKMGEKQIDLLLDLEMEVFRGVVQSLQVDWPNFDKEGWVIDEAELPGVVEQIERDPEGDRMTIQLAKRIGQGDPLRLRLRVKRVLPGLAEQEFPLTLPHVVASNPVRVVAANQENVESRITPAEGTETQPLSASLTEEVDVLLKEPGRRDFLGRRQQSFLVRTDQHAFRVMLVTHPQSISCEVRVRVTVSEDEVKVRQTLSYDVDYAPATQLRVGVPLSFPAGAQFSIGQVPLPLEWNGLEDENLRQARLTLPEPTLGPFELSTEYKVPDAAAGARRLPIALVRAMDAEKSAVRLEFVSDYRPEVTVAEPGWNKTTDAELAHVWTASEPGDAVTLSWTPRREADIQSFAIRGSRIHSVVQRQGQIYSIAEYQFDEAPEQLLVSLPPEQIRPDAFYWNGLELSLEQVSETEAGSGLFRLELPGETPATGSPTLAVAYHTPENVVLNWSQDFDLAAPSFPGDVWMEKTIWDVTLPVDQHLFSPPADYTPEFTWTRQGAIWSRVPRASADDSAAFRALPDSPAGDLLPSEGNTYRFSYVGPCPPLKFTSMNRSMVVLFGAGLALLCGFILLKIPATRNVLTILFVVFAFALAGVWFAAPMQLLIQPALLGLILAVVAVLMDGSFKRRSSPGVVSLSNASDYSGSSAAHAFPGYPEPIGSEDPTAVRQNAEHRAGSSEIPRHSSEQRTADHAHSEFVGSSIAEKPE